MTLLDTNVLIEILKGDAETKARVETLDGPLAVSAISAMELFYGARDKAEVARLERFLGLFRIVQIDHAISLRGVDLVRGFAKSHGLDIPDALIAATALEKGFSLLTYNRKDFRFIPGLGLR